MNKFAAKKVSKKVKVRGPISEEKTLTVDAGELKADVGYFIIDDGCNRYPIEPNVFYKTYQDIPQNISEINNWVEVSKKPITVQAYGPVKEERVVETLEGEVKASVGDYIISGIDDERYVLSEKEFNSNYFVPE